MARKLIKSFIELESSGGIILFFSALTAIILANTPAGPYIDDLLEVSLSFQMGSFTLSKHFLHWINDGLMALFFLLVGLEIKREVIEGELSSFSRVVLPGICAIGGMIMPALIFSYFNWGDDYAMRGWAIPTATDIAFSLGILSLLGKRVPSSLKVFLTALAIFDDMGAIIIIAIFYTAELSFLSLALGFLCILALVALNQFNAKGYAPYFLVGTLLWICLLKSGVHATLAGVILAFAIPLKNIREKRPNFSQLKHLEHKLHPWIAFLVLPVFAFANAGVALRDLPAGLNNIFSPVMLGIALGLLIGKLIGVLGMAFIGIKLGFAGMPGGSNWTQLMGIALICGVGFTMSFFIGTLAYPGGTSVEPYAEWVRLGVIVGSLASGLLGYIILKWSSKERILPKKNHLQTLKKSGY